MFMGYISRILVYKLNNCCLNEYKLTENQSLLLLSFLLRVSLAVVAKFAVSCVAPFTEEILRGKLHILYDVNLWLKTFSESWFLILNVFERRKSLWKPFDKCSPLTFHHLELNISYFDNKNRQYKYSWLLKYWLLIGWS